MIRHFKTPEFKINSGTFFILLLVLSIIYGCREEGKKEVSQESQSKKRDSLIAKTYNSGFSLSHDTYNGLSSASDGNIYYVLSSQSIDTGAQVYVFHPETEIIEHLGDLTQICGEKGQKSIVSHAASLQKTRLFFPDTFLPRSGSSDFFTETRKILSCVPDSCIQDPCGPDARSR